jgi:rsbT co-antagonist protein RsbR
MNATEIAAVKKVAQVLEQFLGGDLEARIGAGMPEGDLSELGFKLDQLLEHAAVDAESFHRINMSMADALTDWFEVLQEAKTGNLDARIAGEYGDDFLDKLSEQINETLANLKALQDTSDQQRQQLIEQQSKIIQELSTPIIQVWDEVLALPIIGIVDSLRAQDMMEKLLEHVVAKQARCVIIDLTGVTMMDTKTADYLIKMVKAATLVGSSCIITGIGPVVAQTITRMGLDLEGIVTLRDLRDGLKRAFQDLGLEVAEKRR